ncbi:MAG: cytochrome d ubiquinol oxidase subunit II, partial [Bifidobacteriaceae bacterium]|nr:cytochrome d ubiquinol oxidase subunit II [Bifidobacteriaceae bacterium]
MLSNILALAPAAVDPQVTEDTAGGLVGLLHHLAQTPTAMQTLWFVLIAVLWTGYLVLEGFDFGVGMLLPFIGKKDSERRAMLSTIGPLWDGNEVWVLTAGGAMFAAFPEWYATLFSAAYLPLFLILVGLIIRAVAFEYRGKINGDGWRRLWDWCIVLGSWIPAILWGVAFANLVSGVKAAVDPAQLGSTKILYDGTFFDLVFAHKGFLLLGGLTTAALFLAHGAIFLSLKTDGVVRQRSESLAPKLSIAATLIAAVWVVWLGFAYNGQNHPTILVWIGIVVAAVALIGVVGTTWIKKFGYAFASMTVALLAAVVTIFAALFPNVINGSRVTIEGEAIADPIVGAVVLGVDDSDGLADLEDGVNLEDVVNVTFDRVAADGLPNTPSPESANAEPDTQAILDAVAAGAYPALGFLPQERIQQAVEATVARVGANGGIPDTAATSEWAKGWSATLTPLILQNVADKAYPAIGVIPDSGVKAVVDATFARVMAAVEAGDVNPAEVGVGVEPSELAVALTVTVLDDLANGIEDTAGVISLDNVGIVVVVTLARLGLPIDEATVTAVVEDVIGHKDALDALKAGEITLDDLAEATIAGLPANAVATEVARTVEALVPHIQGSVDVVVEEIKKSVDQIVNVEVVATLEAVANNGGNRTFTDETDVTDIVTGTAWDNDLGLANLNPRIEAANEALDALVTLGLLPEHKPLEPFEDGAVI